MAGIKVEVDKLGIDVCLASTQKCFALPPGLAVCSISQEAINKASTVKNRGYYLDFLTLLKKNKVNQTPTTPPIPQIRGLVAQLDYIINREGIENRFKRHATCAKAFYSGFEALKLTPYPKEDVRSNTVIVVNVPSEVNSERVRQVMRERYRVLIAGGLGKLRGQVFRIGCMGIISQAETLATINAFENTLADSNFPVDFGVGIEAARKGFHS